MTTTTFGDMLDAAERHFAAAEATRSHATGSADTIRTLHRLVTSMARALVSVVSQDMIESAVQPESGIWRRTASELRAGLLAAGDALDTAAVRLDGSDTADVSLADPAELPVPARHLWSAASALTAGCDLLSTHFAVDRDGVRVPRSDWAHLLAAQPIAAGLAVEMATWSRRAASWATRLAPATSPPSSTAQAALKTAAERLWAASQIAASDHSDAAIGRDLVRGFPLATPPDRRKPDQVETTTELYEGLAASADRLRAIAFTMPEQSATSPWISGPVWRYTAHAAAIVSHAGSLILQALAERSEQLPTPSANAGPITQAASAMATARQAWEQAATMWRTMTTDTQTKESPATIETSDLVLRIGRLAFADPLWTPSRGHRAQLRDPAVLAADLTEFRRALAAVHQAADALAQTAAADPAAISTVGSASRFYMPETVLWSPNPQAQDYSTAPRDRVMLLQDVYQVIASTSHRAARALDDLALNLATPSRIIALARKATPQGNQPQLTDPDLTLEDLQPRLKYFGRIKNGRAAGQADLDPPAVIRAYTERQLSLIECAHRFSASEETIRAVLKEHGVPIRSSLLSGAEPRSRGKNAHPKSPPNTTAPAPQSVRGPVERTVRAMKVDDPRLLLRAAALDKAAADLVTQAQQSPAQLAAQDTPRATQQPARPPETAPTPKAARRPATSNPRRSGARR